jgi:hypothetical protein
VIMLGAAACFAAGAAFVKIGPGPSEPGPKSDIESSVWQCHSARRPEFPSRSRKISAIVK